MISKKGVEPAVDLTKRFQSARHGTHVHGLLLPNGKDLILQPGYIEEKIFLDLWLEMQLELLTSLCNQEPLQVFYRVKTLRLKSV
jgi:hypothetical protein